MKTHRIKLGHSGRRRGPANLIALCGIEDGRHRLAFIPSGRPITCANCQRIEKAGNVRPYWAMPDWMEPYRDLFRNTGGNSVEDLYNDSTPELGRVGVLAV